MALFEGFMEFLKVLTIKGKTVLQVDKVVLNMVNMRRQAVVSLAGKFSIIVPST